MIDEEVAADRRAGMDVDRGQEAREVIDRAREQEQPRLEQPVRGPVQPQRPDAGIKHDLPTRSRGDRKSVVEGKSVSVRVGPGCRRNLKNKKETKDMNTEMTT